MCEVGCVSLGTHRSSGCDTVCTGKRPFSVEPAAAALFRAEVVLSVI